MGNKPHLLCQSNDLIWDESPIDNELKEDVYEILFTNQNHPGVLAFCLLCFAGRFNVQSGSGHGQDLPQSRPSERTQ